MSESLSRRKVEEILNKIRKLDDPRITFVTIMQFIKILAELIRIYEQQIARKGVSDERYSSREGN